MLIRAIRAIAVHPLSSLVTRHSRSPPPTDLVAHDRTFDPDARRAARYDDLFALYRPAYEALRPISRALARRGDP